VRGLAVAPKQEVNMHTTRSITLMIFLLSPSFVALEQQPSESCRAEFTDPKQGDTVSNDGNAKGTATVAPGKHLWIFAHRRGLALWWPQGGGPAQLENQKWVAFVTYGQDRDRGSEFELAAIMLEEKDHADMLNVVKRYEERGEYPGVRLPPHARDCPMTKIVVIKR
jgi:hypothetical protein